MSVLFAGLCVLAVASTGWSQDTEIAGSRYDSLFHAEGLHAIHLSLHVDKTLREVSNAGTVMDLEAEHYYGQLGIDPLKWLTVSAGVGSSVLTSVPEGSEENASLLWMIGAEARLLQFKIKEPSFLASRCRLDAYASYWDNSSEVFGQEANWTETRAALLGSAEFFVADLGNDISAYPYSVVYSIGVVFSDLEGDITAPAGVGPWTGFPVLAFEDEEHVGVLGGVEIKIAYNLVLEWEARIFNNVSHSIGLRYSF
jgi:hypothetical protein